MSFASPRFRPAGGEAIRPAAPPPASPSPDPTSPRGPLLAGAIASAILLAGTAFWGAGSALDSAVVASGVVEAGTARHQVQHPVGGRLAALLVAEGDAVLAGAPLARLDPGGLAAERAVVAGQLREALARAARLEAERADAATLTAPASLTGPEAEAALDAQRRLLAARRMTLEQQIAQLRRRQAQARDQRAGLLAQAAALADEAALVAADHAAQSALLAAGLTPAARVTALAREAARLRGAQAAAEAEAAALEGRITEIDLQVLALRAARREEAEVGLNELAPVLTELAARLAALDERLEQLVLRAPVAGRVHGLTAAGPGAVLRPAEPLAEIIPDGPPGRIAARIRPEDIGRLRPDQPARVRLPAWGGPDPPELAARIARISADSFDDPRSGQRFFRVEIALDPDQPILATRPLHPGEPAEVLITTGSRSPLSWLMAPLSVYFTGALRED